MNLTRRWESRNLNVFTYRCVQVNLVPIPYDSKCVTVSVSIAVSVHASVSALVSVSVLVTVYCYFRHPGALPPPSPQLLQLPFCSVISSTGSLSNPLSPEAEKCHPEKAAQPSGGCTSTSRLSSTFPWRCTKPHRGTRKHSSQAEKRRENSLPISR